MVNYHNTRISKNHTASSNKVLGTNNFVLTFDKKTTNKESFASHCFSIWEQRTERSSTRAVFMVKLEQVEWWQIHVKKKHKSISTICSEPQNRTKHQHHNQRANTINNILFLQHHHLHHLNLVVNHLSSPGATLKMLLLVWSESRCFPNFVCFFWFLWECVGLIFDD